MASETWPDALQFFVILIARLVSLKDQGYFLYFSLAIQKYFQLVPSSSLEDLPVDKTNKYHTSE